MPPAKMKKVRFNPTKHRKFNPKIHVERRRQPPKDILVVNTSLKAAALSGAVIPPKTQLERVFTVGLGRARRILDRERRKNKADRIVYRGVMRGPKREGESIFLDRRKTAHEYGPNKIKIQKKRNEKK